ncbi:lipopolysaccharide biosynthesis protein [Pedobacter agri]|uniref:lipopolysaccharide biosynthesis protein n=1 Tax=Pedobacter agri TaxID=454586 RepID=UPI0027D90C4B|nr:lipopolysaccharide biosynthesis protein [Pedobacter agri]
MEANNIKASAVTGSVWALVEKFSIQLMTFVISIVLARLLSPKDFGLIVLATIFSGISAAISDGGFEKTLIQKKEISPVQIDTVFYVNVALGIILTVTLYFSAGYIAVFFKEPKLSEVVKFISIGTFLNALSQVQRALLMKELQFKKISIASIIGGSFGGGIVGISLAVSGFGVWALVFSSLAAQFLVVVVFWTKSNWYPSLRFSFSSIKGMLPFGLNILFSSILFFFIQQFSNFIIGKYYSGRDLGLVNRGSKTPEMVTGVLHSVVLKIAFPFFAKSQNDNILFNKLLKRIVQTVGFFTFPLLFLIFANAHDITIFLFTDKWVSSVIFLQIFCFIKIFDPFVTLFREVILSQGYAKMLSVAITITSVIEVLLILVGVSIGLHYVVFAMLASVIFQYIYYVLLLYRQINIPVLEQLKWISPYLVLSFLAALSCFAFDHIFHDFTDLIFIRLLIKILIGGGVYVVGLFFFKTNEASYFKIKNNGLLILKSKI